MKNLFFNKFVDYKIKNNKIFVGYNLRFHPFIKSIKKMIINKKIWNINVICGSYLPIWRKGREYEKSYSAKKISGGVLLDLSHELDYLKWIFGNFKPLYAIHNKISDLNIKSYDNLNLFARGRNKLNIQLNLNYFFKIPMRQILIDGENLSINADLISNTMHVVNYKKNKVYNLDNFDINTTYSKQHNEIINNNIKNICTFKEGKQIMKVINKINKINL